MKRLSRLEKAAGCGKKRPPADLAWLFPQVTKASRDNYEHRATLEDHSLFRQLSSEDVPPLDKQTYRQWRSFMGQQRLSHPRRLRQRTIIIQPLTAPSLPGYTLAEVHSRVLDHLQHFCSAFFMGMSIELAPPLDLTTLPNLTSRVHKDTQRLQYLVGDILKYLERRRPRHAQCVIAVTTVDLFPSSEWNFVLGHASLTSGCGVFGFGRYFSSQFSNSVPTVGRQMEELWVLVRVVSHELCHTLGMKHCYYFHCAMNESTSIEQASEQPLFLCPVCLRKLKKMLRFNIFKRYDYLREAVSKMTDATQTSMGKNRDTCQPWTTDNHRSLELSREKNGLPQEIISGSLDQGSPLNSVSQLMHLQQACEWLDQAKETFSHE